MGHVYLGGVDGRRAAASDPLLEVDLRPDRRPHALRSHRRFRRGRARQTAPVGGNPIQTSAHVVSDAGWRVGTTEHATKCPVASSPKRSPTQATRTGGCGRRTGRRLARARAADRRLRRRAERRASRPTSVRRASRAAAAPLRAAPPPGRRWRAPRGRAPTAARYAARGAARSACARTGGACRRPGRPSSAARPPLPAWWTIVIAGRWRTSQPARLMRRQRSGSSE